MNVQMRDRDAVMHDIGERVFDARRTKGYSQEKLARLTELSRETVRKIEAGETLPELLTLDAIAQALDLALMDLLPEDLDKRALFNGQPLALMAS